MLAGFELIDINNRRFLEFAIDSDIKSTAERIKSTDQDVTQYSYDSDRQRWKISACPSSFEEFESQTGIDLPDDALSYDEPVNITLEDGDLYIELDPIPNVIVEELRYRFSYEVEEYNRRTEEHYSYLETVVEDEGIPIGLRYRVEDVLDEMGVTYDITDNRSQPGWGTHDFEWRFPHDLRDYQWEAVSRMMKGSCVIQIPTAGGKTVTALRAIYEMGLPTLVLVHKVDLLEQWREEVKNILGTEPGIIREDTHDIRPVTIAMLQTLLNTEYMIDDFDILVPDEVHHISADKFYEVAMRTDAYYRFGLSATAGENMRSDNKGIKIISGVGPNDVEMGAPYLIEEGYLAEPTFEWIYPPRVDGNFSNWQDAYREGIVENDTRNALITEKAAEKMKNDDTVLIDVKRIDHGERLLKSLNGCVRTKDEGVYQIKRKGEVVGESESVIDAIDQAVESVDRPVFWVYGEDRSDVREHVLALFKRDRISCLISTLLGEGINIPSMNVVILAGGGKSSIQTIQTIGRALRPGETGTAAIADVKDVGPFIGNHTKERVQTMESYYDEYFDNRPMGI